MESMQLNDVSVNMDKQYNIILTLGGQSFMLDEQAAERIQSHMTNFLFEIDMMHHEEEQRRQFDD